MAASSWLRGYQFNPGLMNALNKENREFQLLIILLAGCSVQIESGIKTTALRYFIHLEPNAGAAQNITRLLH